MDEAELYPSLRSGNSFIWALCFEVSLGLVALLLGYGVTDTWPAARLEWPPTGASLLMGIASALPILGVMVGTRHVPWKPLQELTEYVNTKLLPMFRGLRLHELALLSLAAGWGEEVLFRGLVQAEISQRGGPLMGVLAASFVFALLHFITPTYFVIAWLISCYLGGLFWYFDSLWVPLLGHAGYDFLMLLVMLREDPKHGSLVTRSTREIS